MKTYMLVLLLVFSVACTPKQEQTTTADSLASGDSTPAETTATSSATDDLFKYEQQIDDSTATRVLKWTGIDMSEYGPSYGFEGLNGDYIPIRIIEIPGFDFENNIYFTATYSDETVFPKVELKPETKDVWYKVTIQDQNREMTGVGGIFPVILAMEPI